MSCILYKYNINQPNTKMTTLDQELRSGMIEELKLENDALIHIMNAAMEKGNARNTIIGAIGEYLAGELVKTYTMVDRVEPVMDMNKEHRADFLVYLHGEDDPIKMESKSVLSSYISKDKRVEGGLKGSYGCAANYPHPVLLPNGNTVFTGCLLRSNFEMLSICLRPFTGEWNFAFLNARKHHDIPAPDRKRTHGEYGEDNASYLYRSSAKIKWPLQEPFYADPTVVFNDILNDRRNQDEQS